jgi:thiamine biosynthesis lipoprotein ApbE
MAVSYRECIPGAKLSTMTDKNNNPTVNPAEFIDVISTMYTVNDDTAGAMYDDAIEAYWNDYEEWAADFYYEEPVPDYVVYYPSE